MTSQTASYSAPARLLHWLMAALILIMLFIGVVMVSISSAERQTLISMHKTIGVLILVLGIARLVWRFVSSPPPAPIGEPRWRKRIADATHIVFYGLILAMPLIGWAMQTAGGYPVAIFGGLHLPHIVPQNGELHAVLRAAHRIGAYALYALFLLHLSAALFHTFVLEDGVLKRMVRGKRKNAFRSGRQ